MSDRKAKRRPARKHVQMFLPNETYQRLQQRAKQESLPLSTWLRTLAVKELNKPAA
jgi:hypothetical protein